MRGAVLYQLGLKVDERIARYHYGIYTSPLFRDGYPEENKSIAFDDKEYCIGVMKWYVQKVLHLPSLLMK
jgi:hypothetical protein